MSKEEKQFGGCNNELYLQLLLTDTWLEVQSAADQPEQLTLIVPPCIPRKNKSN